MRHAGKLLHAFWTFGKVRRQILSTRSDQGLQFCAAFGVFFKKDAECTFLGRTDELQVHHLQPVADSDTFRR